MAQHSPPLNRIPTLEHEKSLWSQGYRFVAGLDEAGRGALAGPVVAGAVILAPDADHQLLLAAGVRDSKLLAPARREKLFHLICQQAAATGVGIVPATTIDRRGIVAATRRAMNKALARLSISPEALLIDYITLPDQSLPQRSMPYGDRISLSIAAASILAKVVRDSLLVSYGNRYLLYGFARHKGYGTAAHRAALAHFGPCDIHRRTFRPLREMLNT